VIGGPFTLTLRPFVAFGIGQDMSQKLLGAARLFASHYQIVICDDPRKIGSDFANWKDDKGNRGFAGSPTFRSVGTEADLNDHWVELVLSDEPPDLEEWQRVTCVDFRSDSGAVSVMSVIDDVPPISATIGQGEYTAFVAAQNVGVDQLSLAEEHELSDAELAARKDLEWYRIFLVAGKPQTVGRIVDRTDAAD